MLHEQHARNIIFGYKEQQELRSRKNTSLDSAYVHELVEGFLTKEGDTEGHSKAVLYVMWFHSTAPLESSSSKSY